MSSEGQRLVTRRCHVSVGFQDHQHCHCSAALDLLHVCAQRHIRVTLISVKELSKVKRGPGQWCKRRQLLWWAKRLPAPKGGSVDGWHAGAMLSWFEGWKWHSLDGEWEKELG